MTFEIQVRFTVMGADEEEALTLLGEELEELEQTVESPIANYQIEKVIYD